MKLKTLSIMLLLASMSWAQTPNLKAAPKITPKAAAPAAATPSVGLSCSPPTTGVLPDSYNFYRAAVSGGPYTKVGSSGSCAFTDTTVTFSATYYYVATSVNTLTCPVGMTCESVYSNQATAVVGVNPVPNAPTNLTVGTIVANSVPLSWQESGKYTAFRVFRKPSNRNWWSLIATGIKPTSWTNVGVPAGKYNYEVKAVNNVGGKIYLSQPSNVVTAIVN